MRTFKRGHGRATALLTVVLAGAACPLALAACGSSSNSSRTGASVSPHLAFAKCMRADGVPNFPDGPNIPGTLGGPAFQSAAKECLKFLRPGGGPHGGLPEATRLSLLHHAECMRAHGVPGYPDPVIPSHCPCSFGPPPGINTDAPAFTRAAAACGGP